MRDRLPAGSLAGLRLSAFAGERLLTETARYWARAATNAVIDNIYGPTEAAVAVTAYRWDPARDADAAVPIGWPHAGTTLLILDEHDRPVTRDGTGELYIGGAQVFAGYLEPAHDSGWFRWLDGRCWYRTGDQVRVRRDGALLHLWRNDSQVKVNGYRVELGEIEAALHAVAGTDAVAFAIDTPTGPVLTACVLGGAEPR